MCVQGSRPWYKMCILRLCQPLGKLLFRNSWHSLILPTLSCALPLSRDQLEAMQLLVRDTGLPPGMFFLPCRLDNCTSFFTSQLKRCLLREPGSPAHLAPRTSFASTVAIQHLFMCLFNQHPSIPLVYMPIGGGVSQGTSLVRSAP